MAKFDNAKVGDRVWSSMFGWGTIEEIDLKAMYELLVCFDECDGQERYSLYGYCSISHLVPTLFWNEFHIPTEEEDRKPFNLVEFLRENLKPVEFEYGQYNYYISYENDIKEFEYKYDYYNEDIGTVYLKEIDNGKMIASLLDFNKVTPKQLKDAYRMLGWL